MLSPADLLKINEYNVIYLCVCPPYLKVRVKPTIYFSEQLETILVHSNGNIPADVLVDILPALAVN